MLIARFYFVAVVFSFEETNEAIDRFLSYSVTDRTFRTSRGGAEADIEVEVHEVEGEMEGKNFQTYVYSFSCLLIVRF